MADKSSIEWTDATWNIITGCTLVDEGCRNCYAAHLIASWPAIGNHPSRKGLARKNAAGEAKFTGEVRFNEQWLDQPLRWKKPRRIFVCAHGDLFHESVPDEWIDRVFAVMALAPQHAFQVLTKRPERARAYLAGDGLELADASRAATIAFAATDMLRVPDGHPSFRAFGDPEEPHLVLAHWPLPNVWLGTSASDQASADLRIPPLLAAPAAVRFLSAEPLLGPMDLSEIAIARPELRASVIVDALRGTGGFDGPPGRLDWVIVGGESGPRARPMHPDWARSLRDQCVAAGVPFFFKQWGEWADHTDAHKHEGSEDRVILSTGQVIGVGVRKHGVGAVEPDWRARGAAWMTRVGKARAGRLLDGRTWDQMPGVADGN